jgi:hypothetical protein
MIIKWAEVRRIMRLSITTQNTFLPLSAEWAVALSYRMMGFSANYGHFSVIAQCRWYCTFDLYCSFTVKSFGSDGTQVHLGCHRPQ